MMPAEYLILAVVGVFSIGGGLWLRRQAKNYRSRRIQQAVLENPELPLPLPLVQDTLLSLDEAKVGLLTEYKFGESEKGTR